MPHTQNNIRLSLAIPSYNSKDKIEKTLEQLTAVLERQGVSYEILLRDDGSTDGTAEFLKTLPRRDFRLEWFVNNENQGLGSTLRDLFARAKGEKIIYLDMDLPYGAGIIPELLAGLERHDIVVASRYLGMRNKILLRRKIASRIYSGVCKFLFHIPVMDIGSGSVGIRRQALQDLDLKAAGFDIHVEMFAKARLRGLDIEELPAVSYDIGQGSFRILKHGPKIIWQTIRLWFELRGKNALEVPASDHDS